MVSCSQSSTLSTYTVMSVTSMGYSSSPSFVGAPPGKGLVVYPWSSRLVKSGRMRPRDVRYSAGPLLASWVGWWRRKALDKRVQGACSRGGGCSGHFAGSRHGWVRGVACRGFHSHRGLVPMLLCVVRVSELQPEQAVDVQGHGVVVGVCVLGCCHVVQWVCHVCARGMCSDGCGVVRPCPGECAVRYGCDLWTLAEGRLGLRFHPRVWFRLLLAVGAGLVCCVWGFWGWCRWGGGWCRGGVVRCCSCVGGLRCPMSLVSASWFVAVSRAGPSDEVRGGGNAAWCSGAGLCVGFPIRGGGITPGPGGLGGCLWGRAVPLRLLVFPPVFAGPWAMWNLCRVGPGVPGVACAGLECRSQGGVVAWCPDVSAHCLGGPGTWGAPSVGRVLAARSVGSTGWSVAVSSACCGPGAADVVREWLCVAGVYVLH